MVTIIACLLLISITLALSGVLTYWSKMTNIGDSIAHALLFSLVISYFLNTCEFYSILICSVLIIAFITFSDIDTRIDNTTKLVVLTTIAISTSIMLNDYTNGQVRLKEFLLGSIFGITNRELLISLVILSSNLAFIYVCYEKLVLLTISEEIAIVQGVNTKLLKLLIRSIIIFSVAFSIKIVGVLLISSLLIIPAAIARLVAKTPIEMIVYAVAASLISSTISLILSYIYNISYPPLISFFLCLAFYIKSICKK